MKKPMPSGLKILQVPEDVRGYRDIRRPMMEEARKKVAQLAHVFRRKTARTRKATPLAVFCGDAIR